PQQIVDAGLGAGLRVDALDNDGTIQAVRAVGCRQRARYDDRPGRYAAVIGFAGTAIIDAGALGKEHAHGQHGVLFHNDAFDDFGAGTDEAVVFDDGRVGLQRLQHAADAHTAREVHVAADLRA